MLEYILGKMVLGTPTAFIWECSSRIFWIWQRNFGFHSRRV